MTNYLLDTNICVFILRQEKSVTKKLQHVQVANCFLSEITALELVYGAASSKNPKLHQHVVTQFLSNFTIIPIRTCFEIFVSEKSRLKVAGFMISDFDLLIGATAIAHDFTMVTDNTKHFDRLNNIKLENWVEP